jgi:hypothetical protein
MSGGAPSVWNAHSVTSSWPDSTMIGHRIVIRYRTGGTAVSGRPELTDVIGHVRSVSADDVQVERRDGTVATVVRADTVTWKPVPDQRR